MTRVRPLCAALALALLPMIGPAQASSVVPTFDRFGPLPEATFGGTGIPNDAVAVTEIVDDGNTITLGLTAHQRFANPPLSNDGAGTFTATTGANFGDPTGATMPSSIKGATWNFAFFMKIEGGGTFDDYQFDVLYDFDPGAGTDEADHGILDINAAILAGGGTLSDFTLVQGSQNSLFGFLNDGSLPFITPPSFSPFDPNVQGEYSFALITSQDEAELGRSAIVVNVVPEPSSLALAGCGALGLIGAAGLRRRFAR